MKDRKSQRSLRKLIRTIIDARAGNRAAAQDLAAHLRNRPEDRKAAQDLERLWDDVGRVPAPELRIPPTREREPLAGRMFGRLHWSLPVALAAGAAAIYVLAPSATPSVSHSPEVQHYSAVASTRTLRLTDGSIVTLAPRSTLDVAFSARQRALTLATGEAFFQVVHDTTRPFIVATAHGETRAAGTAFAVQLDRDVATVTVAEGKIQIAGTNSDLKRYATAGQQVRYELGANGATTIGEPAATQDRNALSWHTGMLAFEGVPLDVVVAEMNRYTPRPITITDPALASLPIFATIKTDSPDGLFAILAAQTKRNPAEIRRALRVEGAG